jgi:hypothetical protein
MLIDPAPGRLASAAGPVQQPFACRQQFTATQFCNDSVVQVLKDANRIRISVSAQRFPLVHPQNAAIE